MARALPVFFVLRMKGSDRLGAAVRGRPARDGGGPARDPGAPHPVPDGPHLFARIVLALALWRNLGAGLPHRVPRLRHPVPGLRELLPGLPALQIPEARLRCREARNQVRVNSRRFPLDSNAYSEGGRR